MSDTIIPVLRRVFDVLCATAGLALLIFLGPCLLWVASMTHVPEASSLQRIEGVVDECHPGFGGVDLRLQGQDRRFRLQLDSCAELEGAPGRPKAVALHASLAADPLLNRAAVIHVFGFEVGGTVSHAAASDLQVARLDRSILLVTSTIATTALVWLIWMVSTHRRGIVALLVGELSHR